MESRQENRQHQRYEENSPIHLYRMDFQDQPSYAEMKDYSAGGLCLVTDVKLSADQFVYLEIKNKENFQAHGFLTGKNCSGSVRWGCPYTPPSHADNKNLYQYGIEYFRPV